MTQQAPAHRFWIYIAESTRILYWAYFKPFTFTNWLREIDPELKSDSNPFPKKAEFPTNPRLQRYASQVWWLTAMVPLLAMLFVAPIYSLAAGEPFNWQRSELFWLGWLIGLLPVRWDNKRLENWFNRLLFISIGIILLLAISIGVAPNFMRLLVQELPFFVDIPSGAAQLYTIAWGVASGVVWHLMSSVAFGVAWGVISGVASGVTWGVISGIISGGTFGVVLGVASGLYCVECPALLGHVFGVVSLLAWGRILNVASGVTWGVTSGMMLGIAWHLTSLRVRDVVLGWVVLSVFLSLALGLVSGVASGVAFILGVLRAYFWLPELLWAFLLFTFTRQGKAVQSLRYLPPRFDELIHLPLPFIDTLIVEAYRENPAAACETIDYLIASTNQQKVAAQAIVGIAIDLLNLCQTLPAIVSISAQLAWIPSPAPAQLGTILPQFLEISQSVRSAETATSAYRQTELLAPPITSLRNLRDSLAFGKDARLATAFGSIAERWLSILETALQTLEEQARHSVEIPQVYVAGPALEPENAKNRFKGRIDIFREIETVALSSQPPVLLLYGGRRTGKTSVLKYLPQKVGSELVPLLVDLQGIAGATTLLGVAQFLAQQIIEAALKSRNLHLPAPDPKRLREDPFPALRNWFTQIEGIAPGKRFLLCLDEFERLSEVVNATNSRAPLDFLRHIMQHRQQWILLFSGSHTLDELDSYWSDYLINTRSLRVSYLQEPEARELIVQPVQDFPDIYEPEAVEQIISLTRCQPYLVQLLCTVVVDRLNQQKRRQATAQDVQTIIPKALEVGWGYFNELWTTTLLPQEQELVKKMIFGEQPDQTDKATVRKLVQKEILEKEENRFQVPLVQRYIEQVVREEI